MVESDCVCYMGFLNRFIIIQANKIFSILALNMGDMSDMAIRTFELIIEMR